MDERLEEVLALYALGDLTDAEKQEMEAYLAQHPEAEQRLDELLWASSALVHTIPPLPLPKQKEQALMQRVTADAQARFPAAHTAVSRPGLGERLRALFTTPLVGGVGYALAAVALVWVVFLAGRASDLGRQNQKQLAQVASLQATVATLQMEKSALADDLSTLTTENAGLRGELTQLRQERDTAVDQLASLFAEMDDLEVTLADLLAANEEMAAQVTAVQQLNISLQNDLTAAAQIATLITSPQTQRIILPGTEAQPQAQGELLYEPDSQIAILLVDGMSTLDPDQVYQVLLIRNDGHDTAETFAVDVQGQSALIVHAQAPLSTFTSVGVSIEPRGGSPQRTGAVILLGDLVRS